MQVRLRVDESESHYLNTDLLQICCLVIAPTFYSAALYWAAGLAIANVAPQKSWLSGRAFKTLFITADLVSLIVQAVGGGMAGSAVGTDPQQVKTGSKWVVSRAPDRPSGGKLTATFSIMLAGIVIQLVVMLFYVGYTAIWVFRARERVKLAGSRFQWMLVGMLAASIGIIVRGVSLWPSRIGLGLALTWRPLRCSATVPRNSQKGSRDGSRRSKSGCCSTPSPSRSRLSSSSKSFACPRAPSC